MSLVPPVAHILKFLQSALDKGFCYNTLRYVIQMLAMSALTGIKWADNSLVRQFLQATNTLKPTLVLRVQRLVVSNCPYIL